jgi:hypothetical protein
VRVVLVAVVCDKPAAHKVGGFGSHSHMNFCTLCWITTHDKSKPAAFERGGASLLSVRPTLTCYSLPSSYGRRAPSSRGRVPQIGISNCSQDVCEEPRDALHATFAPTLLQSRRTDCHRSDAQSLPWYVVFPLCHCRVLMLMSTRPCQDTFLRYLGPTQDPSP